MHGSIEIARPSAAAAAAAIADRLFGQFAEHSSNVLWIADAATGKFVFLNPVAQRSWAVDGALSLADWSAQLHPDDAEDVGSRRRRVDAGLSQRMGYRLVAGGAIRSFRETSFLIPASGASCACVAGIAEDISEGMAIYSADVDGGWARAMTSTLSALGHRHKHFASAEQLTHVADSLLPGCILLGIDGGSGTLDDALRRLRNAAPEVPVIVIGPAGLPHDVIVRVIQGGAADFLACPLAPDRLTDMLATIRLRLPADASPAPSTRPEDRLSQLPRREREVLMGLLDGGTNKVIGRKLGISPRTVEVHRAHLMERLNVRSLPELLRLALQSGLGSAAPAET